MLICSTVRDRPDASISGGWQPLTMMRRQRRSFGPRVHFLFPRGDCGWRKTQISETPRCDAAVDWRTWGKGDNPVDSSGATSASRVVRMVSGKARQSAFMKSMGRMDRYGLFQSNQGLAAPNCSS